MERVLIKSLILAVMFSVTGQNFASQSSSMQGSASSTSLLYKGLGIAVFGAVAGIGIGLYKYQQKRVARDKLVTLNAQLVEIKEFIGSYEGSENLSDYEACISFFNALFPKIEKLNAVLDQHQKNELALLCMNFTQVKSLQIREESLLSFGQWLNVLLDQITKKYFR